MLTTHKPSNTLAITVINPTMSAPPLAARIAPTIHTDSTRCAPLVMQVKPSPIATAPIANRNSSSPNPGLPSGKLENNRFSEASRLYEWAHPFNLLRSQRAKKPLISESFANPLGVLAMPLRLGYSPRISIPSYNKKARAPDAILSRER
jgi:hypothetical protein